MCVSQRLSRKSNANRNVLYRFIFPIEVYPLRFCCVISISFDKQINSTVVGLSAERFTVRVCMIESTNKLTRWALPMQLQRKTTWSRHTHTHTNETLMVCLQRKNFLVFNCKQILRWLRWVTQTHEHQKHKPYECQPLFAISLYSYYILLMLFTAFVYGRNEPISEWRVKSTLCVCGSSHFLWISIVFEHSHISLHHFNFWFQRSLFVHTHTRRRENIIQFIIWTMFWILSRI